MPEPALQKPAQGRKRENPYLFGDTIVKLIQTPNLEYKELTAQQAEPAA